MLYSYKKATPDFPSPGKTIPRYLRAFPILMSSLGLALVVSVVWPMVSYQVAYFFNQENQDFGLLSPSVYESLASNETSSNNNAPVVLSGVDYTKASNWFTFSPSPKTTSSTTSGGQSQFIALENGLDKPVQALITTEYKISIPSLGIKDASVKSDSDDLAKSLIQLPQTALPGELGSPVIVGHSTLPQFYNPKNYLTIFATLPTIKPNADIQVAYAGVSYTYRINNIYEVKPTDIWILEQDYSKKSIKIVTCVPPGTTLRRLVVEADLIPT